MCSIGRCLSAEGLLLRINKQHHRGERGVHFYASREERAMLGVVASKVGILYRGTQTPRHESTSLFFPLLFFFMTPPAMSPSSLFAPFQCSLSILTGHYQRPTPRRLSQCQYCSIIADIRLSTTLSHLQPFCYRPINQVLHIFF